MSILNRLRCVSTLGESVFAGSSYHNRVSRFHKIIPKILKFKFHKIILKILRFKQYIVFFLKMESSSVTQAGVQWHATTLVNFCILVETGFYLVRQVGLKLLTLGDLPTLASRSAGIT